MTNPLDGREEEFARTINVVLEDFGVTLSCPVRVREGYRPLKTVGEVAVYHSGTGGGHSIADRSGKFLVAGDD